MKKLLLLVLFCAIPTRSQVLKIEGGSSSLMQGTGAAATVYLPSSTIYGALAYSQGRVGIGLSDTFQWRNSTVIAGTNSLGWGFDGVGLGLQISGISVSRKTKEWNVTLFAGAVGLGRVLPFALTGSLQHVGAGLFVTRKLGKGVKLYDLEAIDGGRDTAAAGADWNWQRKISATGGGGLANGTKFMDGQVTYSPWQFLNLSASRSDYFAPYRATGQSASASFSYDRYNAQISLNESISKGQTNRGESISGGTHFGVGPWNVQEQVGYYKSARASFINSNTTEKMGHYTVSESVSESNGQKSYAVDGGYSSNRLSVSVDHSIVFLIGESAGFQQVTGITVSIRLPSDTTLNFQTVTTPFGKPLFTTSASKYVQLGDNVPGQAVSKPWGGKFIVEGLCKDAAGPVAGCAVRINSTVAYSNERGEWSVRLNKSKVVALEVLPSVFATAGDFEVVSAPSEVAPGAPITIILRRKP